MANIKFSAFTQKVVQTNVDFLVGYTGADNVRITPAALGDGIYLPLGGGTMIGNINFNDNVYARFGNGNDLDIGHDASNSYITHGGVGNLIIQNTEDNADIIFKSDDGSGGVATYFYLDGSAANPGNYLITLFPDNSRLVLGDGWDIQMWHDGVDGKFYNATGDWSFEQAANDKDIIFYCDDGAGGTTTYFKLDGSSTDIQYFKDLVIADNVKAKFGNSSDLEIYHDGSDSYIRDTGTGYLKITASRLRVLNPSQAEEMIDATENGAVELYYDGAKTFETTATGIEVTDEVSIGTSLVHTGDTDTKVTFGTNNITLIAGGATHFVAVSDQTTILYSGNAQTLFCDTNQNVGIGNNNPNQSGLGIDHTVVTIGTAAGMGMVELTGTRTVDGDLGRLTWLNAATRRSEIVVSRIDENTSTKMAFSTSNAGSMGTRMTIAKDGDVGIGTSTPGSILELSKSTDGGIGSELRLMNPHNSDNVNQIWFGHRNSGYAVSKIQSVAVLGGNNTQLKFVTEGASTIATRMIITQDGDVGIGTDTPVSVLNIKEEDPTLTIESNRTTVVADEILGQIDFRTNEASFLGAPATSARIRVDESQYAATTMSFWTSINPADALVQQMTITPSGDVGIGTDTPTAALQVVGLAEHADNAAALTAGLTAGAFYRTGDLLKVVH